MLLSYGACPGEQASFLASHHFQDGTWQCQSAGEGSVWLVLHLASVPWALGHMDDRGGSVDCRRTQGRLQSVGAKLAHPFC